MAQVVVYTQSGCVLSQVWLEVLREAGVPYHQKSLTHDATAAAELRAHGQLATPTTVVGGVPLAGFDRRYLARLPVAPAASSP